MDILVPKDATYKLNSNSEITVTHDTLVNISTPVNGWIKVRNTTYS
jgi:hypothetical protein